ncbi:MAG: hypothetical protein RSB70_04775 [Clostridium sp.]
MYKFLGIALIIIGFTEGRIAYLIKKEKGLNSFFKDKDDKFKNIFSDMCNLEGIVDVLIGSLGIILSSSVFIAISWVCSIILFYIIYTKKVDESNEL